MEYTRVTFKNDPPEMPHSMMRCYELLFSNKCNITHDHWPREKEKKMEKDGEMEIEA